MNNSWTRKDHEYQGEYGLYQSECLISPDGKLKIALEEPSYLWDYNLLEDCYPEVEQVIIHEPYLSHYRAANEDTCGIASWLQEVEDYAATDEDLLNALRKHCARNNLVMVFYSWRGYSQGDWLDYALIAEKDEYHTPETLATIADEYDAYLSGDVYEAVVYELHTIRDEDTGETWSEWRTPDDGGLTGAVYTMPYWRVPTDTILSDVASYL